MIEAGVFPVFGGVAGGAVSSKLPLMFIITGMAGDAGIGCAFEDFIGMAVFAGSTDMGAGQGKCGLGMIKRGILPAFRGVACGTILAQFPVVGIICVVAGGAVLRGSHEDTPGMAILALQLLVFTG